jgi:hypothetical protein
MSVEIEMGVKDLDATTAAWVTAYREARGQMAMWQEKMEVARANIESAMGDAELGLIKGNHAVRWSYSKPVERFDTKKAREILPPQVLDVLMVVGKPVRSFHVVMDDE